MTDIKNLNSINKEYLVDAISYVCERTVSKNDNNCYTVTVNISNIGFNKKVAGTNIVTVSEDGNGFNVSFRDNKKSIYIDYSEAEQLLETLLKFQELDSFYTKMTALPISE